MLRKEAWEGVVMQKLFSLMTFSVPVGHVYNHPLRPEMII